MVEYALGLPDVALCGVTMRTTSVGVCAMRRHCRRNVGDRSSMASRVGRYMSGNVMFCGSVTAARAARSAPYTRSAGGNEWLAISASWRTVFDCAKTETPATPRTLDAAATIAIAPRDCMMQLDGAYRSSVARSFVREDDRRAGCG